MMARHFIRILGIICALGGVGIMGYVVFPIITYRLDGGTRFKEYLSPVPEGEVFANAEVDFTKASNWFAGGKTDFETVDVSKVRYYNISIPKLKIEDAVVAIGGDDLSQSLIQYPGTALPGKRGNAVIFGHSTLPQFYNPRDYMAIFSTLPTIKKQDEVLVRYDGITYRYTVEEVFEVSPTDLEILAQNIADSYITLITCTPPGHPLRPKRLIVRARLDPLGTLTDNGQSSWN